MTITRTDSGLLFRALLGNAVFSGVSGLVLLLAAAPVAAATGIQPPGVLMAVGIGLIGFCVLLLRHVRREHITRAEAVLISALDLGWVLGSIGLLVLYADLFTPTGYIAVIAVAIVVLLFFELQALALWQTRRTEPA